MSRSGVPVMAKIGRFTRLDCRPGKEKDVELFLKNAKAQIDEEMRTETGASGLKKEEKRRKWHSLWGQICDRRNVEAAWRRVRRNRGAPGIDGVTVEEFEERAIEELDRLERELRDGSYEPLPVRRVMIPKPDGSERPLGIPGKLPRV